MSDSQKTLTYVAIEKWLLVLTFYDKDKMHLRRSAQKIHSELLLKAK